MMTILHFIGILCGFAGCSIGYYFGMLWTKHDLEHQYNTFAEAYMTLVEARLQESEQENAELKDKLRAPNVRTWPVEKRKNAVYACMNDYNHNITHASAALGLKRQTLSDWYNQYKEKIEAEECSKIAESYYNNELVMVSSE